MATSLKVQAVKGPHQAEWDMRGDKFKGAADGDDHKTLAEIDPCPPELILLMEDDTARSAIQTFAEHIVPGIVNEVTGYKVVARLYDGAEE